jgi:hypothetical protein
MLLWVSFLCATGDSILFREEQTLLSLESAKAVPLRWPVAQN